MLKAVAVLVTIACLGCMAGCGGGSSSATTTVYELPALIDGPAPATQALLGGSVQGRQLVLTATPASAFAGSSAGFSNLSSAGSATFNRPIAVTTDGANLYVADYYNNVIRQINVATRHVTTIAGSVLALAGSVDGTGTAAAFNRPNGITTDGTNLYVTDSGNFTIRKIVISSGAVSTLAGGVGLAGSVDASGTAARFGVLNGITINAGNLYVTDSSNTIRRIEISTGKVTTLAGSPGTTGSADGDPKTARFNLPARLTTDGPNLYVADFSNSTIRKIALATGTVTTIAGLVGPGGAAGSHADASAGLNARFNQPNGITCDGINLYVTDSYDNTVRRIVLSSSTVSAGAVTTLATVSTAPAGSALPNSTIGITTDGASLYLTDFTADTLSHTIQRIQ